MVREDLERLDGVVSISLEPSDLTATCEVQTREGQLLDPAVVATRIKNTRLGASLRGIEITVEGTPRRLGKKLVLDAPGLKQPIELCQLRAKVQLDVKRNRPQAMSRQEREAFQRLVKIWTGHAGRVRLTGPVRRLKEERFELQVRQFEFDPAGLGP